MNKLAYLAIPCLAAAAVPANAATTIAVTNASFEADALAPGTYQGDGNNGAYGTTVPTGWSLSAGGQAGAQNFGNDTYFKPADGAQSAYVNNGSIFQNLGALRANTTYIATVAAGNQPNYSPGTGTISFLNGSTLLSSTAVTGIPVGTMQDFTTRFTTGATVSGDLIIDLAKTGALQVQFDNVRVSAVPEPAVWAMMILGMGVVGSVLRRRQKVSTAVTFA